MERNPNYWKGPAKIAKIEARDVPSPATQKLQVENGDIDVAVNVTPDLTAAMKGNKNVRVLVGQSLDNMYMGVTVDPALHPALAKKEVRQALRHAVDRAGIIKLTNGSDDAQIEPGDTVTWTYEVVNCGQVPFTQAEIVITDDTDSSNGFASQPSASISSSQKSAIFSSIPSMRPVDSPAATMRSIMGGKIFFFESATERLSPFSTSTLTPLMLCSTT